VQAQHGVFCDHPLVNVFDVIAILLILLCAIAGFRSGALPQVFGLAGALLALAVGLLLVPHLLGPLAILDPLPRALLVVVGLLVGIGVGEAVGSAVGRRMGMALGRGVAGAFDHVAGVFVGALQALLVIWLVGGLLAIGPASRLSSIASGSATLRALGTVLPEPAEVAGDVAVLLDDSGLPDLFVGLEPLPAPPVDRPTTPEARRIGEAAAGSTLRVSSSACDRVMTGTGIVIARGYVVTNAHVVAGSTTTRVTGEAGSFDAVPVLVDPELDVAVLYATRLDAPTLRFATSDPNRGAVGAALGYPGGGGLAVVPAAVTRQMEATGRDIYGRRAVTRDVLELRAAIERGDSGGPLVLADGTVGGLVFAESRTDPDVGYALAATAVAVRVMPAIGRTSPVGTGACIP
jgi:S1-C subfamily serine protease